MLSRNALRRITARNCQWQACALPVSAEASCMRWDRPPPVRQPGLYHVQTRSFRQCFLLSKQKGGKQDAKKNIEKAKGTADAANNDPDDFTVLEDQIAQAQSRMKEELSKLRPGGQFNHELLDALKVILDKNSKDTVRLGDIATVVPKSGRQIMVMVSEQDYVKPVSSAILSSQYNFNPSANPHNPLELQINVPPPTAESKKQVLDAADKTADLTLHTIRQARGAQQKKLNAMEKVRTVRPDDLKKSRAKMEKVVEDANKAVKETLKKAKSALEK